MCPQDSPSRKELPGQAYTATPTRYVARRGSRYKVRWSENGMRRHRSFASYEAACAFVRDYVEPFKANEGVLPPSAIAPAKGSGWVYVFRSGGPGAPVKVGFSTDPAKRLRYLATGHPYRIDLVALLPGSRGLERALHARLADFRLEGEWFSREAEAEITGVLADAFAGDVGPIPCTSQRGA